MVVVLKKSVMINRTYKTFYYFELKQLAKIYSSGRDLTRDIYMPTTMRFWYNKGNTKKKLEFVTSQYKSAKFADRSRESVISNYFPYLSAEN